MGFENFPSAKVETPKLSRTEKEAILSGANINDPDILDKVARVCGVRAESLHENELDYLKKFVKEGGHQPLEWSVGDEKIFFEDDGKAILGHVSKN